MAFDPISWMIIAFIAGAATGYFWDDIRAWATRAIGYIVDAINRAIEVASDAIVFLVKESTRVYKRVVVYVKNTRSGGIRKEYRQEQISEDDIPNDILAQLKARGELKLMQQN